MGLFDWLFGKNSPPRQHYEDYRTSASDDPEWQVGDRVLACWYDSYFYPGRVRKSADGYSEIAFDDGDICWVQDVNILVPDIQVGSKVFCRFQSGPYYYPGKVDKQNGEKIYVIYDDGNREWTTIHMVRVLRALAPGTQPPQPPQSFQVSMGQIPQGMPPLPGGYPGETLGGFGYPQGGGPNGAPPITMAPPQIPGMPAPPQTSIPDLGDPLTDSTWSEGDRVLGRWFDLYWYPATILAMGTKGYLLLFDDGGQRVVSEVGLMPLMLEEGEEIFIRQKNQPQRIYTPGRILRVEGETIDVELEDGTRETNHRVSRARFWRCPVGFKELIYEEGDRVWGHDVDGFTYPAEIIHIDHDKVIVHFLDGPERMLTPELLRPFSVKKGLEVECRWKGGQMYFPGTIGEIQGERIFLNYADGDQEWTTIRLVRIPPSPLA